MATAGGKNGDFYAVLGLNRECSGTELRNAYKKLALRWHPDRCSAAGKSEFAKEAKEKFQAIQEAYSILSDSNKRFLYDVGVYDRDDDDETEMGNFLDEMVQMMSQTKHNESSLDSFEDLQQLFVEMVEADIDLSGFGCGPVRGPNPSPDSAKSGKRRGPFTASASGKARLEELNPGSAGFRFGVIAHVDIPNWKCTKTRGDLANTGKAGSRSHGRFCGSFFSLGYRPNLLHYCMENTVRRSFVVFLLSFLGLLRYNSPRTIPLRWSCWWDQAPFG